jgi:hypothetical protein
MSGMKTAGEPAGMMDFARERGFSALAGAAAP